LAERIQDSCVYPRCQVQNPPSVPEIFSNPACSHSYPKYRRTTNQVSPAVVEVKSHLAIRGSSTCTASLGIALRTRLPDPRPLTGDREGPMYPDEPPGTSIQFGSRSDNGQVSFWIKDFGRGIRPEDRERIFARFARGPVRDDPKDPGSDFRS
jgi:hypothetical protein